MKITKIKIRNLFGIKETELDGRSIEISGKNGTGKTSVIDSIRYALTNKSDRDYIIRNGESEGEILAAEEKLKTLNIKLEAKNQTIEAEYEAKIAKLDKDIGTANDYIDRDVIDTSELSDEIAYAEAMKKHLNEFARMTRKQEETDMLTKKSNELTDKIELARDLPGEILKTATLPVEGLTVKDGIPLIDGLPVTNLSEGEKLELCVDVAISKSSNLQIILIDGVERLSDENRDRLYKKCKEKGLQFIATRTTNSDELEINYL